jgi:hypothetical protein
MPFLAFERAAARGLRTTPKAGTASVALRDHQIAAELPRSGEQVKTWAT